MASELAGLREFAQLMADHIFGYQDRDVHLTIMDAKVKPIISGMMVEARAQVLMTVFSPALSLPIFFNSFSSIYGPFLIERDMFVYLRLRRCTMNLFDFFFGLRVLCPPVTLPCMVLGRRVPRP